MHDPPHLYHCQISDQVRLAQVISTNNNTDDDHHCRSVLSLLLTLIFLSLGIACLTVLYLIIRHRAGHQPQARPSNRSRQHSCWGLAHSASYWWRRATENKNKLVEDFSDDEGI